MTHEEWLEDRRRSLGGSDAAGILGLNTFTTAYSIWCDKTGRTQPSEDNEAMRQGRDLEQYVADRWMEVTGKRCRRRTKVLRNPAYPFAHANVDRWVVGENAGLECKTTSTLNLKKFKNGEFPDYYYCQCMHYMAVTGADRWYLGVLVLGREFMTFVIERDQAEIDALMATEADFWHYVENDTPPPVDGLEPTTTAINEIYRSAETSKEIQLDQAAETIRRHQELKAQIDDLAQEKELLEQQLKEALKEAEIGRCGDYLIKWKPCSKRTFQTKSYAKDNPDLDLDAYYKTSTYRKFEIKN